MGVLQFPWIVTLLGNSCFKQIEEELFEICGNRSLEVSLELHFVLKTEKFFSSFFINDTQGSCCS